MNFAFLFTSDDKDQPLSNFVLLTEHSVFNIFITAWRYSRLITSLEFKKATGQEKIPVVFRKNITPEISSLMQNISTAARRRDVSPILCKLSNM